jgi:RHH-type transcriptional regulator, rel operon repressor / antitoxin RelB
LYNTSRKTLFSSSPRRRGPSEIKGLDSRLRGDDGFFEVPYGVFFLEVSMLAIRLPDAIESRLNALALETGRAKSTLAREAILEYIDDLEDFYLAEARARANRNAIPLAEVERELGL